MISTSHPPASQSSPVDLRILCVDDDPVSQRMLVAILARPGWSVECVSDGQEALDRYVGDAPGFDLLVTDHLMPHLAGLGLVQHLRALGFAGPVIVVSGTITEEDAAAYRAVGVGTLLAKPVGKASLIAAVQFARGALAADAKPPPSSAESTTTTPPDFG